MIGIEPDDTFEYDVDADTGKPPEQHRVLIFRHATARHWLRHAAKVKAIRSGTPLGEQYIEQLEEAINQSLTGWKGIAAAFETTTLGDVFQTIELEHIAETLPIRARVGEYEKKVLSLRSPTSSASSAPPAGPGTASAPGPDCPGPGTSAADAPGSTAGAAAAAADGS